MNKNRQSLTIINLISLLILLTIAVIFVHSELSLPHHDESIEFHAQHDYTSLISNTIQPHWNNTNIRHVAVESIIQSEDILITGNIRRNTPQLLIFFNSQNTPVYIFLETLLI